MKKTILTVCEWLKSLSFRTGVLVAVCSIICYTISFIQFLLPISLAAKGVLWAIFFGMAKMCQYSALMILGKEGIRRLKRILKRH